MEIGSDCTQIGEGEEHDQGGRQPDQHQQLEKSPCVDRHFSLAVHGPDGCGCSTPTWAVIAMRSRPLTFRGT